MDEIHTTGTINPDRRRLLATSAMGIAVAGAASLLATSTFAGSSATNLFLLEELEDIGRTGKLAVSDLDALRAVANWTKTFVARPHNDLGRTGAVCPFVPVAWEHKALWLAAERSAGRSAKDVIKLVEGYKQLLLAAQPVDGEDAKYKSIVVVFTDLPAVRAKDFLGAVLQNIGVSSYADDGLVLGPFYEGNDATAIHNPNFRPFTSPVPLLLIRPGVISDWKFFLNNEDWLKLWARRYGESAVATLADELRRLPWRARQG
jgi:hypothetical protein